MTMWATPYQDRSEAGQHLAHALDHHRHAPGVLLLALRRGGVPVAYEVARAFRAPLDVCVVRKIGHPQQREFALGAMAGGGVRVDMACASVPVEAGALEEVMQEEREELARRERLYRAGRPTPAWTGRTVVLVDDGLATGASMRAALQAVRAPSPLRLVAAAPVGARDTCEALRACADEVVCPRTPEPFDAVGRWYRDFPQVSDAEVQALLAKAQHFTQ